MALAVFLLEALPLYSSAVLIINGECFPTMGMFAAANQIVGQLYMYEGGYFPGLVVDFDVGGVYYDGRRGSNWWNYYFAPICLGVENGADVRPATRNEYVKAFEMRRNLPRSLISKIVNKYIRIKPAILDKALTFVAQFFKDYYVIGVHYRGTDKYQEAPHVPYETVIDQVREVIPETQPYRIFVATDESPFLQQMYQAFPDHVIATSASRVAGGKRGIHLLHADPYASGEEALIDALLLSKCDCLIRTSSNLSLWATYFNPEIPVVLLNRRYLNTLEPE